MNNKIKILVVEDDQFIREFYEELLTQEGYTIDAAVDGEMALSKIKQGGWSIILLDIMLPKLDGLQVLKNLKSTPVSSNGPIIVLTNLGNNTTINQAFELGASGYLIKSAMNPDEVLQEIKNFLPKQ